MSLPDPPAIVDVINTTIHAALPLSDSKFPSFAALICPPFPERPLHCSIVPFSQWASPGVWIPSEPSKVGSHDEASDLNGAHDDRFPHDALGVPLLELNISNGTGRQSYQSRHSALRRITMNDCWKIGDEDTTWIEPEWASREIYDIRQPPFTRLLTAARDFQVSRREAFQYNRTLALFHLLREALGIIHKYDGEHWSGQGPDGLPYIPPSKVRRGRGDENPFSHPGAHDDLDVGNELESSSDEEVCVFLTKPETSVRGFLALARREAEAGWDFAPALNLAKICSAFMSFLVHWDVLPEDRINPGLLRASALAKTAPRRLLEAKRLEDTLADPRGWNRAVWTIWGGSYGDRDKSANSSAAPTVSDDAGEAAKDEWTLERGQTSEMSLQVEDLMGEVEPLLVPLQRDQISMIDYIPYSRRVITAVIPPLDQVSTHPAFMSHLYQLVTSPSPWSSEEKWRVRDAREDNNVSDSEGDGHTAFLEKEKATIKEPDEIVIWIEADALSDAEGNGNELINMGLRGRWARMGKKGSDVDDHTWWTFMGKDFVLPSFWRSNAV